MGIHNNYTVAVIPFGSSRIKEKIRVIMMTEKQYQSTEKPTHTCVWHERVTADIENLFKRVCSPKSDNWKFVVTIFSIIGVVAMLWFSFDARLSVMEKTYTNLMSSIVKLEVSGENREKMLDSMQNEIRELLKELKSYQLQRKKDSKS
jgi:hypothetical protein